LLDSSAILEIPDPLVSEIGPSSFAELGLAEQIIALCIGRKPEHPVFPEN
jgi:hypothetical protein